MLTMSAKSALHSKQNETPASLRSAPSTIGVARTPGIQSASATSFRSVEAPAADLALQSKKTKHQQQLNQRLNENQLLGIFVRSGRSWACGGVTGVCHRDPTVAPHGESPHVKKDPLESRDVRRTSALDTFLGSSSSLSQEQFSGSTSGQTPRNAASSTAPFFETFLQIKPRYCFAPRDAVGFLVRKATQNLWFADAPRLWYRPWREWLAPSCSPLAQMHCQRTALSNFGSGAATS